VNINPYIRINPVNKLSIYAGIYLLQRQSIQDGTYSPGLVQVRPTPANIFASKKKGIGTQYALETNYDLNKNISFAIDGAYFVAGDYVSETGKEMNIFYLALREQSNFKPGIVIGIISNGGH
jgi:hypothetical protein